MISALFQIGHYLLWILWLIIIVQVVLSLLVAFDVLNTRSAGVRAFVNAMDRITEPLYRPIRRILPNFGAIDFSPLVVLILITIADILLKGAERTVLHGSL
jgi:YggT family protein